MLLALVACALLAHGAAAQATVATGADAETGVKLVKDFNSKLAAVVGADGQVRADRAVSRPRGRLHRLSP